MPFPRYVPSGEIDAPQRNALEQYLGNLQPPGLAQAGSMLQEHLRSLGPVLPAARGAADLMDVFGKLGPIGAGVGDLNQRATGALNAAGDRLEAGADALRPPRDFLPGLSTEPADVINPTHLAQGAAHAVLTGLGDSALGTPDDRLLEQGRAELDALSPAQQRLVSGSRTGDAAARFVAQGNQLGEAWAGTGLRDVGEDAAGAVARTGLRRGQRGRRIAPLSPEEQAARAADMRAEEGIFGAIQDLWKRGLSDEADDLRLTAMGKGRQGLVAARDYLTQRGILEPVRRFLSEEEGSLTLPPGARLPTMGEVADVATAAPLLRPTSLLGNAASGGLRTVQRWAEESGGALAVDRSAMESVADLAGMAQELPAALRAFLPNVKKGGTSATRTQLGATGQSLVSQPGKAATAATLGTRLNIATDEFWRQLNRAGAEARAGARGITDPMDVAELSGRAADFASFAGKASRLADYLGGFRRVLDDPNASGKQKAFAAFMTSLTPYVKTPERVLNATGRILLDPVGLPLSGLEQTGLLRMARQGNREAAREVAGRLLVSGLTYATAGLAYAGGTLFGHPPKDAATRRRLEAAGAQWNTLAGVPLRYLGNFGQAMGAIGTVLLDAQLAAEKGADPSDVVRAGIGSAARWALDESFLRGLSDLNTAVTEGRASQFLEEAGVDAVTRPLSGLAGMVDPLDPYERERRGTADAIRSDLPGGRFTLPTRVDPATGEPVRREGSGLERFLFGSRGVAESPEAKELARLGVTAREFKPQDKAFGVVQTPEARRTLQETYGRYARDYIRDTMARPDYKGASDEEQAATLTRQLNLAEKLASIEVGDKAARDPNARYDLEWLRTPQYRGVEGDPTQIARQNLEISEAKQLLSEYQRRYGETPGRYRFYEEHPELIDFARRPEVPARALAEERDAIRRRTGATDTRDTALVGAGNRTLPAPAFTAP